MQKQIHHNFQERDATSEKIAFIEDAHLPVMRTLLDASANAHLHDDLGKSPVDYAAGSVRGAGTLQILQRYSHSKN